MESNNSNQISIDIPNYTGPLELLLDLAKSQKVDLAEISITLLADQFLEFIKKQEDLNLETASEFLLMATWLAYLKSKLLLPDDDDDDFKALEVAEKLKLQLKKLELIRILSDQMLQKKRLGVHIFSRGMKGGIRSINTPVYDISLYELLKTYSNIQMQKTFQNISIPKLPVFTTEEGIKHLKNDPVQEYNETYPLNSKVTGKIIEIDEKGLKIELDSKKQIFGYIKKSNLSNEKTENKTERFALEEKID